MLILIAEDSDDAREALKILLQGEGYRVLEARNGSEAVALALCRVPALIVMDINMPLMDGVTAIKELRKHDATVRVPIVALSALADRWQDKAFAAGCDEYVVKPCDFQELAAIIERLITTGRSRI